MWQLLNSDMEILIRGGFLYLPLPFDARTEGEIKALTGKAVPGPGGVERFGELLLRVEGDYFIRSLALASLVEHYPAAFPEEYEKQIVELRRRIFPGGVTWPPLLDDRLRTILFEILPHFWRRDRGRRRQKNGWAAVSAFLASKIPDNRQAPFYVKEVQERQAILQEVILRLEALARRKPEPPPGRGPARVLAGWFREELQRHLVSEEIRRWQPEWDRVRELLSLPEAELGALLTVAAQGAVEVDGCGCGPDPLRSGDTLIYVRTGEYVLQDYFGRPYLFPDCRVAVSTAGPFQPMVLETYKHPLLRYMRERQRICLTDYQPEVEFSAAGVIRALEEGLNALFYGYNSRKRNGYNSLDRYGHDLSVVDFEDLRLGQDDVRVMSGELEVKNRYV